MEDVRLILGDARAVLPTLPADSADALVTDPPAGIGFMGLPFDTFGQRANGHAGADREAADRGPGKGAQPFGYGQTQSLAQGRKRVPETRGRFLDFLTPILAECLRVCRPGAVGLVWALPRTSHWTALAIEESGWVLCDKLLHLFGSGFPKHRCHLKPAYEEWILCRKPGPLWLGVEQCRIAAGAGDRQEYGLDGDEGPPHVGVYQEGRERVAYQRDPAGRWPANLCLSHSPGCRQVGTRRVKGAHWQGENPTAPAVPGYGGYAGKVARNGYVDADGTEEVEHWICDPGFSGLVPSFVDTSGACTLADEPECLLGRLRALLPVLRTHSTSDSSLLRSACAFYRSADTLPAEALADEVARVLGATSFLDSTPGYPPCRGFCGELLRPVLAACRSGLPSLCDALAVACSAPSRPARTLHCLSHDLQSISGDLHPSGTPPDKTVSTESEGVPACESSGGTGGHSGGTGAPESLPSGQGGSTRASSNGVAGSHGRGPCNEGTPAAARLLWALGFDLAWRFVLLPDIVRRCDIYINREPCPIRLLDGQAGERKNADGTANNRGGDKVGYGFGGKGRHSEARVYGDSGGPSRFFATFPADAERFLYCSKASKADRGEGNKHPTTKPTKLMEWLVKLAAPEGGLILDPFMGSGSTGVAAVRTGRRFLGIEQEASYHATAAKRLVEAQGPLFAGVSTA